MHDSDKLSERLDALDQRIRNLEIKASGKEKLHFSTRSGFLLINPDDIMYIEAASNYSDIYLSRKEREVVSMNIGGIEEILPDHFIRISRSLIINVDYLIKFSGVTKKCFLKKDNYEISFTIPEKQMPEIKRRILK